ncbi:MAG: family 16 glycosylhydrolase [Clostridiales bacterium]|nr:family 16 glycosylhydrolase [Clostridiales bacterium]
MKNKKVIGITVASALCLALCGGALVGCGDDEPKPQKLTDKALEATKIADFETGAAADREAVFATDGFENGDVFNTFWNAENVSYDNNIAELSISAMEEKEQVLNSEYDAEAAKNDPDYDVPQYVDCQAEYYGGEMRTSEYYGYGDYEVCMKPSSVKGTASTFFVCTGPYDFNYETGEANKHDEIDIEFLGYDTTFVQFNYFVNGVGKHEYRYKLGFDASKEFHTYGFRWSSEYIVWFVDGKPVYKVTAGKNKLMPSTAGRILTNYWTGTERAYDWMKSFDDDFSGKAQYKYIATSAEAQPDPTIAPTPEVNSDVLIGADKVTFTGKGYEGSVSEDEKALTVSYEDISGKGYTNITGDISDIVGDNNVLNFKLVNNGDETAKVRIDIKCEAGIYIDQNTGKPVDFCNLKATLDGENDGDLVDSGNDYVYGGGDWLQIKAGGTVTGSILFKAGEEVGPNMIAFFIDSSTWNDEGTHTGSVTISDLSFSKEEVIEVKPTLPEGEGWTAIELPVQMQGNSDNGIYTAETSANSVRITHSETPVVSSSVSTNVVYGANNLVHMRIKNNLDAAYAMRINVQVTNVWNTTILSAEIIEGGSAENTVNTQGDGWNGITVNLGANAEIVLEFYVGDGAGNLCFGVNNMEGGAASGDVTISEICMKSNQYVAPPVEGAELPEGEGWSAIDLTGPGMYPDDNTYTAQANANSVTITHTTTPSVDGSINHLVTYGNNRIVHFEVTNNGDTAATLKVFAQNTEYWYEASGNLTVDGTATESKIVTIQAGETLVIEFEVTDAAGNICFCLNGTGETRAEAGDITISKLAMKAPATEE